MQSRTLLGCPQRCASTGTSAPLGALWGPCLQHPRAKPPMQRHGCAARQAVTHVEERVQELHGSPRQRELSPAHDFARSLDGTSQPNGGHVRTLEATVHQQPQHQKHKQLSAIHNLTPDTFGEYVENEPLVLVDFYTDWCGPCQLMHKELEKLTKAFPQGVAFAKVNCGQHEEFSTQQRIRSLPTFKLFKGGRCVEQLSGAKPQQLRQILAYHWRPN